MHDLIPIAAVPPSALTAAEIDATMVYAGSGTPRPIRTGRGLKWRGCAALVQRWLQMAGISEG